MQARPGFIQGLAGAGRLQLAVRVSTRSAWCSWGASWDRDDRLWMLVCSWLVPSGCKCMHARVYVRMRVCMGNLVTGKLLLPVSARTSHAV